LHQCISLTICTSPMQMILKVSTTREELSNEKQNK
jgi:hypothetical protein